MPAVPDDLRQRLEQFDQQSVLRFYNTLSENDQKVLLDQIRTVDLEQIRDLFGQRSTTYELPALERISALPVMTPPANAKKLGEQALARGEVAALMVAGGQGSRLGFDHPKGMYPVGPVSHCSLFQIHAEKVLALSRRHGKPIPFLVMTSDATDRETREYFTTWKNFGLDPANVFFFRQGTMPAVDLNTGQLLLESKGRLFLSPNGHGGTLTALNESGLLAQMRQRGIKQFFYWQVDNPLVKVCDPVFLGHHLAANAEVSSKVVRKLTPTDPLGNLVLVDGRCTIVEYSDLPKDWAEKKGKDGQLFFWSGSPAIHVFALDFLERVTRDRVSMPYHIARKKVTCVDEAGKEVKPDSPNALKFELFIFDTLPLAQRWTVLETTRPEEFEPLKNARGADSPQTVKAALSNLAATWFAQSGLKLPRHPDGTLKYPLEISPLYALDQAELGERFNHTSLPPIDGPLLLRVQ